MTNEMVERVAMAIYAECIKCGAFVGTPPLWDFLSDRSKNFRREEARAAITAMMEPTEAMTMVRIPLDGGPEGWKYGPDGTKSIWRAMISAALKD